MPHDTLPERLRDQRWNNLGFYEATAKEAAVALDAAHAERDAALARVAELEGALDRIVQWADAYPTKVFPEPDFKIAAAVLSRNGLSLDAISASNMRHAIGGAGDIARAALKGPRHD